MLERLARFIVRRRRPVLVASLLVVLAAGAFGGGVFGSLKSGGFEDPSAESTRARRLLDGRFGQGDPNVVLVVTAKGGSVDAPEVAAAGAALTKRLGAEADVAQSLSYWTLGSPPPLKSNKGDKALVLARIEGEDTHIDERVHVLAPKYDALDDAVLDVQVTGFAALFEQVGATIEKDLAKAESIAFPLTALALILVFGSAVAAGLPLAIGVVSVLGAFAGLRLITLFTDVSVFSINLITAMGLGLAIDYSLFIVNRYREERRRGLSSDDAVVRSVVTAGRTVLFSALTVAASLAALLVFPLYFLRSFAYGGVAVIAFAAIGAIVVLPALLAALGDNLERLRILRREPKDVGEGVWHTLATAVMRRPVVVAVTAGGLLVLLGLPFLGVRFGLPDDRVLPETASTRVAADTIRRDFSSRESDALSVVAPVVDPAALGGLGDFGARISAVAGVARVDGPAGSYLGGLLVVPASGSPLYQRFVAADSTSAYLNVVPAVEPMSPEGERLVTTIRGMDAPVEIVVGGPSAQLVDSKASLWSKLPLAGGIIAVVTFVVLFMMFGSLLVPAKALVLNLLSLTATFGAMVWVFQDGNGSGLLDFTPTGTLDTTTPILMFCVAFGLSMDYEVFLLSRIKEEHDHGADTVTSVAVGLERTGRIVTAAAALLAIVFIAFSFSGITFIKLFGIGLTMAVLMDATLIRGTLVPAFMRLAGETNWWAPGPLRRFHDRFGISESARLDPHERQGGQDGTAPEPVGARR